MLNWQEIKNLRPFYIRVFEEYLAYVEEKQRQATYVVIQLANSYDNLNLIIEKCNAPFNATANDIKKELLL